MIDLKKLEKQVDEALAKETKESLTKWLDEKRKEEEKYEKKDNLFSNKDNYEQLVSIVGGLLLNLDKFLPELHIVKLTTPYSVLIKDFNNYLK
ncbi:MAG: hypothetical protein GY849_00675 [Deltaproteobacteria bacterium]|nr:hypothetical protein [Deltaproteobacteria bacterium]